VSSGTFKYCRLVKIEVAARRLYSSDSPVHCMNAHVISDDLAIGSDLRAQLQLAGSAWQAHEGRERPEVTVRACFSATWPAIDPSRGGSGQAKPLIHGATSIWFRSGPHWTFARHGIEHKPEFDNSAQLAAKRPFNLGL